MNLKNKSHYCKNEKDASTLDYLTRKSYLCQASLHETCRVVKPFRHYVLLTIMSPFRLKPLGFTLLLALVSSVSYSQDTQENAEFKLAVGLYNDKMYDLAVEQLKRYVDAYPNSQQGVILKSRCVKSRVPPSPGHT